MRELTLKEMSLVAGAGDDCGGNNLGGITDSEGIGKDLINCFRDRQRPI